MGAKKIATGHYAYRGYELAVDATGWRIREEGMSHWPIDGGSTKKEAMCVIDERIDWIEDDADRDQQKSREHMTDAELIAIDGVGWAWLEQRVHISAPVKGE